MGVIGVRWCDFVVYISKGMSIECIFFDEEYWNILKGILKLYYFIYFFFKVVREF